MSQVMNEIREHMETLSDSELIRVVEVDFKDYREKALEIAREELKKRNIPISMRKRIIKVAKEDKKILIYAPFLLRAVAYFIDNFVIGLLIVLLFSFLPTVGLEKFSNNMMGILIGSLLSGGEFIYPIIILIFAWPYYVLFESSPLQATIGKMVTGIIVTDLEGKKISFCKANIRHFSKFISYIILGMGYIMANKTSKKQALHDIIADCLVLEKTSLYR